MLNLLHFADAHIDVANHGRLDPQTGLPVRVVDFLNSLDQIIDTAVQQNVDLVIFAGDAYKDRNPQPTFQREWGKRLMRLSQAGIPTILLVGNHDVARSNYRAHTLEEFRTLDVPHMHVADKLKLWTPDELGIPAQVLAVPWISRSHLMTREDTQGLSVGEVYREMENRIEQGVKLLINQADPTLPLLLTGHVSVTGATFGSERAVMLGHELTLSLGLLRDKRLDYVALGHIHKHQELNGGTHPPIVYPGSIERIDFGEARERKGFVLAQVGRGETSWSFEGLDTRPFYDYRPDTPSQENFMIELLRQLPQPEAVRDAICRVQLTYPRAWEELIDENAIAQRFEHALSFQLQKHRLMHSRSRLGDTVEVEALSMYDLLDKYWEDKALDNDEINKMQELAKEIFGREEAEDELHPHE